MDERRIEALLRHQRGRAVSRALALAANPEDIDVVAQEAGEVPAPKTASQIRPPRLTMRAASFSALGGPEHSST